MALALSEQTIREIEMLAEIHAIDGSALAEKALRKFVHEEKKQIPYQEVEAFRAMHQFLWATRPNQFAAIHNGKFIDHDVDQLTLYRRVAAKFPNQPILIRQILPQADKDRIIL
ncbi:MAG: hypothetical protein R2911_19640 [Caldilineaceae bacterium]